jgi:hypothetical protein
MMRSGVEPEDGSGRRPFSCLQIEHRAHHQFSQRWARGSGVSTRPRP